MKKIAALSLGLLGFLSNPLGVVLAQTPVDIHVSPPNIGVNQAPATVLTNALKIIFILGATVVLFMFVAGAFQWITSGGEKEAVGKARGRIIAALVGLAILALSIVIMKIIGGIVGIDVFAPGSLPSLNSPPQ